MAAVETAGGAPAVIVAVGTALAGLVAAYSARKKAASTEEPVVDPEDRPARLRERLSALEANDTRQDQRLDKLEARRRTSRSSS